MFHKKVIMKNFVKFTEETHVKETFLNTVTGLGLGLQL